jgi:hypothetical protein
MALKYSCAGLAVGAAEACGFFEFAAAGAAAARKGIG